jgi:hypothetical protein
MAWGIERHTFTLLFDLDRTLGKKINNDVVYG